LRDTRAPTGDGWAHEIQYDGYRMAVRIANGKARLLARRGVDWTKRYSGIAAALEKLPAKSAYLDGELCALNADGSTSFNALHGKRSARLAFFVFDLLFLDGEDLQKKPLRERKQRLRKLLLDAPNNLCLVDYFVGEGPRVFTGASQHGAEGIVSKRLDAPYEPGKRSWLKVRCYIAEEFVIVGFTGRSAVGQLLLGYYAEGGRLHYAGRVGTGMTRGERERLAELLQSLIVKTMPVVRQPLPSRFDFGQPLDLETVQWVRPKLVAHERSLAWTADGLLRHAAYLGLRKDQTPREIVRAAPRSSEARAWLKPSRLLRH
jgi:bifunctional non-homologous end joining protein LigD